MRRRKQVIQTVTKKIYTVKDKNVERLEIKQSTHSRTLQILAELGIDSKEWIMENKIIMLNRMQKLNII